jgi:hypothetical protein
MRRKIEPGEKAGKRTSVTTTRGTRQEKEEEKRRAD